MRAHTSILIALSLFLSLVGCDDKGSAAVEAAPTEVRSEKSDSASKKAAAKSTQASAEKKAPRIKPAAPPEKLGAQSEDYGLRVGAPQPKATATSVAGKTLSLKELSGDEPLLVIFYRGGWCPYCNFQIRAMATAYEKLKARGVELVMVSVDEVSESAKTEEAFELPFPALSDAGGSMHRAFRVYKEGKAVPSLFLLADGKVKFAHVDEDYTKRPSEEQIVMMLEDLGYKEK